MLLGTAILAGVLVAAITVLVTIWRWVRVIPAGHIGLVQKRYGPEHPDDVFDVRTHGGAGPQAQTLRANVRHFLPPWTYHSVEIWRLTRVPPGTIGVVHAHYGRPIPPGRHLARHIECADFTDARKFLLAGGEMGRQPHVLTSGSYAINPYVLEVLTVDTIGTGKYGLTAEDLQEIHIPPGTAGVVTTHAGASREQSQEIARTVQNHATFQIAHQFIDNKGQIGTQEQTLESGGIYRINPWFAQISLIPTKHLILEWRPREGKPQENYDAELDRFHVTVGGIGFSMDISQTVRIPPEAAPRLVAQLGDIDHDAFGFTANQKRTPIKRFVNSILAPAVESAIRTIAEGYTPINFLISHAEVQAQLETSLKANLEKDGNASRNGTDGKKKRNWWVEVERTTLKRFEVDDPRLVEGLLRAATAEQEREVLEILKVNIVTERQIEEIRDAIERGHRRLESAHLEDEAKIRSTELTDQIKVLGRDHVALKLFLAELSNMKVPEWVGSGVDILNSLPLPVAKEMINNAMRAAAGSAEPATPLDYAEPAEEVDAPPNRDDGHPDSRRDQDPAHDRGDGGPRRPSS